MSASDAARIDWFMRALAANAPPQAADLPASWQHAVDELRRAYEAGADGAVLVLAFALAEAAQRKMGAGDSPDFDWLRERRNRVAHLDAHDYPDPAELADWTQGAIRIALRLAYGAAWR